MTSYPDPAPRTRPDSRSGGVAVASSNDIEMVAQELATANRILFQRGVVDGFGHVSVRHPHHPDRFLISRSIAPALVTADDVQELDLDGNPLAPGTPPTYLEKYIHSEIYRARPDVGAVVHSHSPAILPFSVVSSVPLRPMCHMSGFLGSQTPVFEIRTVAGRGSDLLVRNRELGVALAKTLGSSAVVLMRGHGSTAVGRNLHQAVFRAVYTEVNARLQSEALRLGPVNYLTEEEAFATAASNDGAIDRAWDLWVRACRNGVV